jgi:hypothetical protein
MRSGRSSVSAVDVSVSGSDSDDEDIYTVLMPVCVDSN